MEVERSAASVEEAIEAALAELGASEQEVEVDILQEPKGGFLGIGGQQAVVRVRRRTMGGPPASPEELEDQADVAAEFLEGLLDAMGIDGDVETNLHDGTMYVEVWLAEDEDDAVGVLIGRHGGTVEALQEIVRGVVARRLDTRCRVIVDVEDYRKSRHSQLASRARSLARKVQKGGRPERLEPMNPYERKIVHDAVAEIEGIETESEGEEPERRVVIRRRRST